MSPAKSFESCPTSTHICRHFEFYEPCPTSRICEDNRTEGVCHVCNIKHVYVCTSFNLCAISSCIQFRASSRHAAFTWLPSRGLERQFQVCRPVRQRPFPQLVALFRHHGYPATRQGKQLSHDVVICTSLTAHQLLYPPRPPSTCITVLCAVEGGGLTCVAGH